MFRALTKPPRFVIPKSFKINTYEKAGGPGVYGGRVETRAPLSRSFLLEGRPVESEVPHSSLSDGLSLVTTADSRELSLVRELADHPGVQRYEDARTSHPCERDAGPLR